MKWLLLAYLIPLIINALFIFVFMIDNYRVYKDWNIWNGGGDAGMIMSIFTIATFIPVLNWFVCGTWVSSLFGRD